jgi:hypothetical protein
MKNPPMSAPGQNRTLRLFTTMSALALTTDVEAGTSSTSGMCKEGDGLRLAAAYGVPPQFAALSHLGSLDG